MTRLFRVGLLLTLGLMSAGIVAEDVPRPSWPEPQGRFSDAQGCVEPLDDMRRNHMRYLLHQRDETVRRGIRTRRHSLLGCISCHAGTDAAGVSVAVDAPGQFCADCHAYASVDLDCFQCHAGVPDADAALLRAGVVR